MLWMQPILRLLQTSEHSPLENWEYPLRHSSYHQWFLISRKKNTVWSLLGLIFGERHFSMDIHHRNILPWGLFGSVDVPVQDILSSWLLRYGDFLAAGYFGTGTFLHWNTLAWGHYGTGKFWHHAKQYEHFGTDILASVQKYVTVPKRVLCRNEIYLLKLNVPVPAKRSPCQNIQVLKCPCAKKSLCWKVHMPKSLLA